MDKLFIVTKKKNYHFLVAAEFESELDAIISLVENPDINQQVDPNVNSSITFTGRGEIIKSRLSKGKDIIIKTLIHGGLHSKSSISKLYRKLYFSFFIPKRTRVFHECRVLIYLRSKGINVPKPVCAIVKPHILPFVYSGYLCLETLSDAVTLLDLVNQNKTKCEILDLCYRAGQLASSCLSHGIRHQDLHLGNVLFSHGNCYLIDFDKAKVSKTNKEDLIFLIDRWNRSVLKRVSNIVLQKEMQSIFEAGLRKNFIPCEVKQRL